jgi:transposase
MTWLSPSGLMQKFDISKSTAYRLIARFEKDGGEVIRIGRLPRVSEDTITDYLRKNNETHA